MAPTIGAVELFKATSNGSVRNDIEQWLLPLGQQHTSPIGSQYQGPTLQWLSLLAIAIQKPDMKHLAP
jgi:hypothetical protein